MSWPIASAGAVAISRASRAMRAEQRQHRLGGGERDRQGEREMAEFGDHSATRLPLARGQG